MQASDIMTRDPVCVRPETSVTDVAATLIEHGISAAPVVDEQDRILGIVSEGDLLRRPDMGTERHPSWWLRLFAEADASGRVDEYLRSHGRTAADVMTSEVVSVGPQTPIRDVAELLESRRIKRVPVVQDGRVAGIVSRANLIQALAAQPQHAPTLPADDRALREKVLSAISKSGIETRCLNVIVAEGLVQVSGTTATEKEARALHVAVESVAPPDQVRYNVVVSPEIIRRASWIT